MTYSREENIQLLAKGVLELSRHCEKSTLEDTIEYKKLKNLTTLAGLLTCDSSEYNPENDEKAFQ